MGFDVNVAFLAFRAGAAPVGFVELLARVERKSITALIFNVLRR